MVSACVSLEPYALRVLDDSMAPEVPSGSVVVVDPGEPAEDGSLVVLEHDGEVLLRRLRTAPSQGSGACARFLAPSRPDLLLDGDWRQAVRGAVTGVRLPRGRAAEPSSPKPGERAASPHGR